MAEEKVKRVHYYRVKVSERNNRFMLSLSDKTRKRFETCVKAEVDALIENLKRGISI